MKDFLLKFTLFLLIPFLVLTAAVLWIPATPKAKSSMLFEQLKKDSLLKNVKSPRIVMIGGSNLSMSLNSQSIKDSLHLNPVNMGLHAAIGLVFMLDHAEPYIRKGDIVLVVPEYAQLYGDFGYGEKELLLTLFDVKSGKFSDLEWRQIKNLLPFFPKYAFTKFKPSEYKKRYRLLKIQTTFNEYGDWEKRFDSVQNTTTYDALAGGLNKKILAKMKDFEHAIAQKGAKMIVSFPAYQEASFNKSAPMIKDIANAYRTNGFTVIGNPEKYKFTNNLMYDTPYHLNAKGVAIRTKMLIQDLKNEAHLKPIN